VRAALEPRGFTVVHPEDHHYRKQFEMFRQADIVVGEDGSAMHNAGFCRKDTPLVVWSRADKVNWWHGPVSLAADLPLTYLHSRTGETGSYEAPVADILNAI
jgi:capsular polysaccharide biosynthesis protein